MLSRRMVVALVGLCLAPVAVVQAGRQLRWERVDDMPMGVFAARVARSGDRALVVGGLAATGQAVDAVQVFDLHAARWLPSFRLRSPRCAHAQVALADGRVLIAGGRVPGPSGRLEPTGTGELIDVPAGVCEPLPPLPRPLAEPTAHRLADGRSIVIGGREAWIFDVQRRSWVARIELRRARSAHASVALSDGRILVVGGVGEPGLELLDPIARTSRLLRAGLPAALDDTRAALLPDGRVWVVGGQWSAGGDTTDRTWIVTCARGPDRVDPGPRLCIAAGVADHGLVRLGAWLVLVGGESQRGGQDVELSVSRLLYPASRRVMPLPPMAGPHDDAAVLAADGAVYVFGGFSLKTLPGGALRVPTAGRAVERLVLAGIGMRGGPVSEGGGPLTARAARSMLWTCADDARGSASAS